MAYLVLTSKILATTKVMNNC